MAPLTAVQLTVAPEVVIEEEDSPVGALQTGTDAVVNCAAVKELDEPEQFVLTLQS